VVILAVEIAQRAKETIMPVRTAKRTSRTTRPTRATPKRKAANGSRAASARKTGRAGAKAKAKSGSPGLTRPVQPDAKLAVVVGVRPLPRTQVVKKMWDYVKAEGLQDRKNRRMINADDKLRPIFGGRRQVSMFDMAKLISAHVQ
jgi:chromatin remodeling complex protein RSC6